MKRLNDVSEDTTCLIKSEAKSALFSSRQLFSRTKPHHARLYLQVRTRAHPDGGEARADTWRHEFPLGVLCRIRQGQVCSSACKGLFGHEDLFLVPFYFNYWCSFTFFSFHTWRVVIVFCWLSFNGKPLNELWPWEGRAAFVCFPESFAPVELSRLIALLKELLVEPKGSWTFDSRE